MITLSCGHSVDDFDDAYSVITKDFDRSGNKALSYQTMCKSCKEEYSKAKTLFVSNEAAHEWLHSNLY